LRANLIEVRQKIRCSRSLCSSQDTDGNLLTEVRGVLTAPSRVGWMNSQCSTRKHGRRSSRSLLSGAGAP
jgi:hypothetical protein